MDIIKDTQIKAPLSVERKVELGDELARVCREFNRLVVLKKDMAKRQVEAMKVLDGQRTEFATILHQGFEMVSEKEYVAGMEFQESVPSGAE